MLTLGGEVGPFTWEKLFAADKPKGEPAEGFNYLRLIKTNRRDNHHLFVLELACFKDSVKHDSVTVCSGSPRRHKFRTAGDSMPGTFKPLPEAGWAVSDVKWKNGKDNHSGRV